MKVRIGYGLGTQGLQGGGDTFTRLVDELERLGFDSLWLSERVTGAAPDPLVALAVAAGRTRKLKLGTSVLVLPGRNPALLAKELATLDVLSAGRLLPAVGLGAVDPLEQQAFGVVREERAAWFDESLTLLRRFWTGEPVFHDGPRYRYEGVAVRPVPAQSPPDIWLGGVAPSELRRVGRVGDGWLPSFCTPEDAARGRAVVEEAAEQAGRRIDPEHFGALVVYSRGTVSPRLAALAARRRPDVDPAELFPVGVDGVRRAVERFVEQGTSKFVLVPAAEPDDWVAELEELAQEVLPLQAELSS